MVIWSGFLILDLLQIEEDILDDPFKINSGGLVTGKDMKGYKTKNDAYDVGTQFYKETHIRFILSILSILFLSPSLSSLND